MATNIQRGGFHPRRGIGQIARPRRYEVASGNSTAVFAGDVVTITTAGVVQPTTAGDTDLALGVVAHTSYWGTLNRIYSNYIPASTTYTPTSRGSIQASYAYVWDDPSIEYIVDVDVGTTAALNYAGLGANMDLIASAGSTVYGRSGHHLDGTYVAGQAQFRIMEMLRRADNDLTLQYQKVSCRINEGSDPFLSLAGI
jgi:hypothetical protein